MNRSRDGMSRGPDNDARSPRSRASAMEDEMDRAGKRTAPSAAPEPAARDARDARDAQDAAWPTGMPYTVEFPDGDGFIGADLEHPAPLPRAGDIVEYLDERGACQRFRVREVIHTLQSSASLRPRVEDRDASPDALARPEADAEGERPGTSGLVRAGLPKVILEAID